jgi:hypothetical protein
MLRKWQALMTEERKRTDSRQLKTVFIGDETLPTHYVNSVNIRSGLEEFFLTFGTALPLEIADIKDLENIDSVNAHAVFRCAISRSVMKQVLDLMTNLYENQTRQIELSQAPQGKDEDYVDNSSRSSEL